jgi:hypothetical protein
MPELVAMALHVLVDRLLDELGLSEARHQRGVADLLLGRLMYFDGRLSACHSVPRYQCRRERHLRVLVYYGVKQQRTLRRNYPTLIEAG